MKLHIFYRHYAIEGTDQKGRPEWFDYEKCFINLLSTVKGKANVEVHVMMDGNASSNFINKYKEYFTLHEIAGGSDFTSFRETYKFAKQLTTGENDLYYFLENDYLHVHGWVDKVFELFNTYANLNY